MYKFRVRNRVQTLGGGRQHTRSRVRRILELQENLVYRMSFRTARITQRNTVCVWREWGVEFRGRAVYLAYLKP